MARWPGCTNDNCAAGHQCRPRHVHGAGFLAGLYENLVKQAKDGTVPMERLDDAVTRILRVKFRAGVFDGVAPCKRTLAGDFKMLASPEQRALARDAVRQSLVLLKNNGGLLPLAANKHVLVAGDAADSIMQAVGRLDHHLAGHRPQQRRLPGRHLGVGRREGRREGRRRLRRTFDRRLYKKKPDVAIVVFGENPYAEFQGDLKVHTLPGSMTQHLEIMKKLQDEKIPVVAILMSGRPLWQNRELNLANAYVAAWLPGTEGGGISDVLFRKKDGAVNFDFTGKLSYSWPRDATGHAAQREQGTLRSAVPVRLRPDLRRAGRARGTARGSGHSGRAHVDGFVLRQGPARAAVVAARLERHRHHAHHHDAGRSRRRPRQGDRGGRPGAGRRAALRVRRRRQGRRADHQRRRRRRLARDQWRRDVAGAPAPRQRRAQGRRNRHGLWRRLRRPSAASPTRCRPFRLASGRSSVCRSSASPRAARTSARSTRR